MAERVTGRSRQDDIAEDIYLGGSSTRGFPQFIGNGAQPGQVHRHGVSGELPDSRDGQESDPPTWGLRSNC